MQKKSLFGNFFWLHHAHVTKDTRLSLLFRTASDEKLGWAWEWGYVYCTVLKSDQTWCNVATLSTRCFITFVCESTEHKHTWNLMGAWCLASIVPLTGGEYTPIQSSGEGWSTFAHVTVTQSPEWVSSVVLMLKETTTVGRRETAIIPVPTSESCVLLLKWGQIHTTC